MSDEALSTSVNLSLPDWIADLTPLLQQKFPSDESKMQLAIELAMRNIEEGSGGPFGAAIFDETDHSVISVGVNRVVPLNNSTAHAEMMAFMLAQKRLKRFRLDQSDHAFALATSAQPCAMCFGACPWAGIRRLLVGARRDDVESLTEFDEGPMPQDWVSALHERGIEVIRDVLREEACAPLLAYENKKGTSY